MIYPFNTNQRDKRYCVFDKIGYFPTVFINTIKKYYLQLEVKIFFLPPAGGKEKKSPPAGGKKKL